MCSLTWRALPVDDTCPRFHRKGSTSSKHGKLKLGDLLHISVFPRPYIIILILILLLGGLEVGIDSRIAELPRISKLSIPEPPDETYCRPNFSVLPKVVAKFKPPVKADARPSAVATKENESVNDKNDGLAMQPISVDSFYGNSRKKQHM